MDDIIFISYSESNANENWEKLVNSFPYAKRISNVNGIYNAYISAAYLAQTEYFYIVDADNIIKNDFKFDYIPDDQAIGTYIWQAENAVNALVYGYGGVKLYKRSELLRLNAPSSITDDNPIAFMDKHDFPISDKFIFLPQVASITAFNTSPYDAWKAAFRECCKLAAFNEYLNLSLTQRKEASERLCIWTTTGYHKLYGNWVILGAKDGKEFGLKYIDNINILSLINNYSFLTYLFTEKYSKHVFNKR